MICALPTWWFWRGGCTRSDSEHGRETPQRRWYFVLRHGRVGRCQVCKTQNQSILIKRYPNAQKASHKKAADKAAFSCYNQKPDLNGQSKHHKRHLPTQKSGNAGWSSPVARQAHNLKAAGSNPAPATTLLRATAAETAI